jgi:hypothetical protein
MHICMNIQHTNTQKHTYQRKHVHRHMRTRKNNIHTYTYTNTHTHIKTNMYAGAREREQTAYMHTHTQTNTHINTHMYAGALEREQTAQLETARARRLYEQTISLQKNALRGEPGASSAAQPSIPRISDAQNRTPTARRTDFDNSGTNLTSVGEPELKDRSSNGGDAPGDLTSGHNLNMENWVGNSQRDLAGGKGNFGASGEREARLVAEKDAALTKIR